MIPTKYDDYDILGIPKNATDDQIKQAYRGEAKCIFSIDVEDWFHILDIPSTPPIIKWDSLPSIVEKNYYLLLELLADHNIKATNFFLGWIAEKYPHLVKEAKARGHNIASHGYGHKLVYQMRPQEFYDDAIKSKNIIENIIGEKICGYRAAGFSITDKTPWFFEKLIEAGYQYDSSVFPAPRSHGGLKTAHCLPQHIAVNGKTIVEFPITVKNILGKRICFFGGGYLRIFPWPVVRIMTEKVLNTGVPVIFYIHPREIDPRHPRLRMRWDRYFKSYVGLRSVPFKLNKILSTFQFTSYEEYLKNNYKAQ